MKGLRQAKPAILRAGSLISSVALLILLLILTVKSHQNLCSPLFLTTLVAWITMNLTQLIEKSQQRNFRLRLNHLIESGDPQDAILELDLQGKLEDCQDQEILEMLAMHLQESTASNTLKIEAELHALQNQINPHFLYNTLEIIRSRAMIQGNDDVSEMVESLAMQFRYCINNSGEMATLQQELDHLHNYLLIQRYRFGDRFQYKELIDETDEQLFCSKLPVLTLQPIVENALLHGINPRVEGGCIVLRVKVVSDRLQISVEDDGIGIPELELQKIRHALGENRPPERRRGKKSSGIALYNVNSRIRLYFGDRYGVDMTSTVGVGTCVLVTLPLIYSDEESRTNERRSSVRGESDN